MKRWRLVEIEDQAWCPQTIRDAVTDSLQFVIRLTHAYAPIAPSLASALFASQSRAVLDLCSGAGGPWPHLQPALARLGLDITVRLSDKYPNLDAFRRASQQSRGAIRFAAAPVDAANVPPELDGFRTLFTSFHHFSPEEAREVVSDAVRQRRCIALFEVTNRRPQTLLKMLLFPLAVLVLTPWIRPFRWSRLCWTYLVPLVPLVTLIDGLISCLRTYTPDELREIIASCPNTAYHWEIGLAAGRPLAPSITYLIGYPLSPGRTPARPTT